MKRANSEVGCCPSPSRCQDAPAESPPEIDDRLDVSTAERLAQTFGALSDPTRVRLIAALAAREQCVHELATGLGMSQSAISHQLRKLRDLRLVRFTKVGRHVYYRLDDEHIATLFAQSLEHVHHG